MNDVAEINSTIEEQVHAEYETSLAPKRALARYRCRFGVDKRVASNQPCRHSPFAVLCEKIVE